MDWSARGGLFARSSEREKKKTRYGKSLFADLLITEAAYVHLDQFAQLAAEVVHMDARTPIGMRRVFVGEKENFHRWWGRRRLLGKASLADFVFSRRKNRCGRRNVPEIELCKCGRKLSPWLLYPEFAERDQADAEAAGGCPAGASNSSRIEKNLHQNEERGPP